MKRDRIYFIDLKSVAPCNTCLSTVKFLHEFSSYCVPLVGWNLNTFSGNDNNKNLLGNKLL